MWAQVLLILALTAVKYFCGTLKAEAEIRHVVALFLADKTAPDAD
jgi:hypothetical protein